MAKRLEFSEFTYGYALTENLGRMNPVKVLPLFPNLIDEGKESGGYDVAVSTGTGLPVLLQFKVPQVMTRPSKWMPTGFTPPYYRAHLRTRLNDDGFCQHSALLMHETNGYLIYYATPRFHTSSALESLFVTGAVVAQSVFVPPSAIGNLTDEDHHLAYSPSSSTVWRRSELVEVLGPTDSESFATKLAAAATAQESAAPIDYRNVLESMVKAIEHSRRADSGSAPSVATSGDEWNQPRIPPREVARRLLENRVPSAAAATFARFWLDSEIVVVKPASKDVPIGS